MKKKNDELTDEQLDQVSGGQQQKVVKLDKITVIGKRSDLNKETTKVAVTGSNKKA